MRPHVQSCELAGVPKKWVRTESGKWQEIELAEIRPETTAPAKRLTRFHQLLLIATFLPLCWLTMMAVHELGHVIGASVSGGSVARVVLHPLTISRTDLSVNPHPLFVAWAGPVAGVLLPLVLVASVKSAGLRWGFLFQLFAGFCLIANGVYVGVGSFEGIGDTGDMLRAGCPVWWLWLFGLVTFPAGLFLWHGLGPNFGLGFSGGKVDHRAAYVSCGLLVLTVMLELVLSTR